MGIIQRVIARMANAGNTQLEQSDCLRNEPTAKARIRGSSAHSLNDVGFGDGLNMTVYTAIGGRIVKFNHYDHTIEREYNATYIINNDEDFESALGKIITLESMKR